MKELLPNLPSPIHQFITNTMIQYLKETPLAARDGDLVHDGFLRGSATICQLIKIDNRDVLAM
ncbi:hypothetical protein HanPSC8_Chr08g0323141 [Helianthus annuus]|nr:hypothetical protein HanPSC8_Chr08g0323141 [Helianthus annuus]